MKKILALAALFLCVLPLAACGGNKETGKEEPQQELLPEYDFVRDFSSMQGYRGWNYYRGDLDGNLFPMTYHEDYGMYRGADYWMKIGIYEVVPGLNAESVISFTSPADTRLDVTATIFRNPPDGFGAGQDGVWFYGVLNDYTSEDLLFSEIVAENEYVLHTVEFSQDVKKGDVIYFALSCNGGQNNDNSVIRINIKTGGTAE